jgi:4-amino-4-deoxy-L-arabinose transferase-like glycosyltransferase
MIWLYWMAAALPWSLVALAWLVRAATQRHHDVRALVADPWRVYLLLWTVAPMLFFTLSGNILATYVLPGLPAFALLVGDVWRPADGDARALRPAVGTVLAASVLVLLVFTAAILTQRHRFDTTFSGKALVRTWEATRASAGERLVYLGQRPASAEFYTRGKAVRVPDVAALAPYLDDATADFIVVRAKDFDALSEAVRVRLAPLGEFGEYRLLREMAR